MQRANPLQKMVLLSSIAFHVPVVDGVRSFVATPPTIFGPLLLHAYPHLSSLFFSFWFVGHILGGGVYRNVPTHNLLARDRHTLFPPCPLLLRTPHDDIVTVVVMVCALTWISLSCDCEIVVEVDVQDGHVPVVVDAELLEGEVVVHDAVLFQRLVHVRRHELLVKSECKTCRYTAPTPEARNMSGLGCVW